MLYSYFRYTGRLFLGCTLFFARCNIIRPSCESKKERLSCRKNTQKNLCERHHFFDCIPSFLCYFLLLSWSTPFPSLVTYLLNVSYGWYSVWWSWLNSQKRENLLQFNTSWLASLRTWYYFRLCFIFSFSGYDLTLIKRSHTSNCCSCLQKF